MARGGGRASRSVKTFSASFSMSSSDRRCLRKVVLVAEHEDRDRVQRREAEERAFRAAEERLMKKAKRAAHDKAQREAEKRAERDAQERARVAEEDRARREAAERAAREAEEQARRQAELEAQQRAAEQAKHEAEQQARRETEKAVADAVLPEAPITPCSCKPLDHVEVGRKGLGRHHCSLLLDLPLGMLHLLN